MKKQLAILGGWVAGLGVAFYAAFKIGTHGMATPETYIDPPHPAMLVTNVVPTPPRIAPQAIVTKQVRTLAVQPQISQPPIHTNKISIVEYIPPNGGNDTKRRWTVLQVSSKGHWSNVTSNEQVSGHYVTNNVTDTNSLGEFRTVSDDGH